MLLIYNDSMQPLCLLIAQEPSSNMPSFFDIYMKKKLHPIAEKAAITEDITGPYSFSRLVPAIVSLNGKKVIHISIV